MPRRQWALLELKELSVAEMAGPWSQSAGLVLFALVLANQAGFPIPATPSLLAAGALASSGRVNLIVVLCAVVAAALSADLVWYSLGRWRGARTLAMLRRRVRPRRWVERVERLFLTHRFGVLLSARFVPELNPVGAGLAGATGVRAASFLLTASASAFVWASAWAGAGYVLTEAMVR
jgi:membrane protein DedA with SNARE-associated domain